ncbi:MAG: DUF4115 domain-containing protein [Magnetococcales bacterium]|nr:DUF4115 domain-containing protein [Magnetococcales bacterium]
MIKKPRLNLVNRGGAVRVNKTLPAAIRKFDPPDPPSPPPPPPPAPPPPEMAPAPLPMPTSENLPDLQPVHTAESVGRFLATARKSQGKSISELAESTHIRDIHLQAIEDGAIERLPGITFVAGFMRLYARHLNIADTDPIESFLETLDQKRQGLQMEKFPAPTKGSHRPGLGLIFLGIALLVGGFAGYEHFYAPNRPIPAIPSSPPLRVESSASEGETFPEPTAISESEKDSASLPPATIGSNVASVAAKPATVAEAAPPATQSATNSFFSLFGRTSNRIATPPDAAPPADAPTEAAIEESPVPTDPIVDGPSEEEIPGDFDNASLQGSSPSDNEHASVTTIAVSAPPAAATTPPGATSPAAGIPANQSLDKTLPVTPAEPAPTLPELPQVSPRPRTVTTSVSAIPPAAAVVSGSVPSAQSSPATSAPGSNSIPADSATTQGPVALPSGTSPPTAGTATNPFTDPGSPSGPPSGKTTSDPTPPAPGNPRTQAREQVIDAHPVPLYSEADPQPTNSRSIALVAKELVWIQIQDKDGIVLKDMVMQPEHVFHIPEGETFYAILGNASGVQVRIGNKTLPFLGDTGEVVQDLELSPEGIQKRARGL